MSVIHRPETEVETSAVCLRFCWHLRYCIPSFWAWVGLLWKWVVYVWASFGKTEFYFPWPVSGKEKLVSMAYQGRIRAERQGERRRPARNAVWQGLHLGCNSQILTPQKLGGHRGTGTYWKLRVMSQDASWENHSWRPPHLGLSAKPCISPGLELRIGRVGTFDRSMPSTIS